jgi:hypothetical protein
MINFQSQSTHLLDADTAKLELLRRELFRQEIVEAFHLFFDITGLRTDKIKKQQVQLAISNHMGLVWSGYLAATINKALLTLPGITAVNRHQYLFFCGLTTKSP